MKKLICLLLALILCMGLTAPALAVGEYGSYGVEYGYSLTYFTGAYSEKARSINCPEAGTDTLIPLNVKSGSTIGFGGMDGYAFPIPFYKATYDAATGTLENLIGIPLQHQFDEYGCAMEITVDTLFQAAASVEGNAVVFSGYPGYDPVNEGVYYATFLLKLDGAEPKPPASTTPGEYAPYTFNWGSKTITFDAAYESASTLKWDGRERDITLVTVKPGSTFDTGFTPFYMMYLETGSYAGSYSATMGDPMEPGLVDKLFENYKYIYVSGANLMFTLGEAEGQDSPEITFPDVKETDWFYQSVNAAAKSGLILGTGSGKFDPKVQLSWAQTVTFAVRLAQYNAGEHVYGAEDQTGNWYDIYVDYALAHGFISEVPANPNALINRGETFVIFAKILKDAEQVNNVADGYFTDLPSDHPAYEAAYELARAGISNGTGDNKFSAEMYLTRDQVATLIARMAGLVDLVTIP